MKAFVGHVWVISKEICRKDISKLAVALFCFLGHWSNPNLVGGSPESLDVQDFRIFGAPWEPLFVNSNSNIPNVFEKSKKFRTIVGKE